MSPDGNPRDLTTVAQDYLKVIWTAQEWSHEKVSTKMLAERIGVSASTASESIRKLADQGLVDHEKYGAVTLTDAGARAALAMVRRHRLMETFLVSELGYGWDEVHDEAEVLEHAVSDLMLDRIDAKLGYPTRDPHGDPIPAADGQVPTPPARQLSVCDDGDAGTVARISDADPEMLRYFDTVGISLDSRLRVLARRDFAGMISVAVEIVGPTAREPPRSNWVALRHKRSGWSKASRQLQRRRATPRPTGAGALVEQGAMTRPSGGRRHETPSDACAFQRSTVPGRFGLVGGGRAVETPAGRPRRAGSSDRGFGELVERPRLSSPKHPTRCAERRQMAADTERGADIPSQRPNVGPRRSSTSSRRRGGRRRAGSQACRTG